jgi:molybdate transport system substrate-binding protein
MRRRTLLLAPFAAAALMAASPKPEVHVLSAAAAQIPAQAIAASFSSAHVAFEFATAGAVEAKLKAGATPDIVITSAERAVALEPDASKRIALGTVRMGVAVRPDAPRPDLSSVAGFAASIQRAGAIGYGDPAKGATTGIHFAKVFAAMKFDGAPPAAVLGTDGLDIVKRVQRGEVALGVTQISEIVHVDPALLAGPLPDEIQLATTYVAVLRAPRSAAAKAFLARLHDAAGAAEFRKAGYQ